MNFKYIKNNALPKLAWLAIINKGEHTVNVICGKQVECHDHFFVAGVWPGDFEKGDFINIDAFQGSGARLTTENGGGYSNMLLR